MTPKALPRRASRSLAFQVLYSQEFIACNSSQELERVFFSLPQDDASAETSSAQTAPSGFAWELMEGVWLHMRELDEVIARFAKNWRLERVGRVELTLLRLALYEMFFRADVPPKVAINEALELNKQFGEDKSSAFINGILDSASKALEKGELRLSEHSQHLI